MAKDKTEIHVTTVFDGELGRNRCVRQPDFPEIRQNKYKRISCSKERFEVMKMRFKRARYRLDCVGKWL